MKVASRFGFDQKTTERIDHIKEISGSESRIEVFRKALCLLEMLTEAEAAGKKIVVCTSDGKPLKVIESK